MPVPYESTGRSGQKQRTRAALVEATRRLMAAGTTPTVEEAAAAAGVSRTAAYRYFGSREALILGAHPETRQESLLGPDAPDDPRRRLDAVLDVHLRTLLEWEPQLRATLRMALDPAVERGSLPLRQGRVIGWLSDALAPLRGTGLDVRRTAIAMRSACGIESLVWLVDVAGLDPKEACAVLRSNVHAILDRALARP